MSKVRHIILYLCSWSILAASLGFAESGGEERLYPLPISEIATAVSNWWSKAGYEIRRVSGQPGEAQLWATKNDEICQVELQSHSVLATRVAVACNRSGQPDEIAGEKLHTFLDNYQKGLSWQTPPPTTKTPPAVLKQIESVVCIRGKVEGKNLQFTGFVIDTNGLIISTAHDVVAQPHLQVMLNSGEELNGHVLKLDHHRDLALISVDGRLPAVVDLRRNRIKPNEGEELYSVGCPLNVMGVVNPGRLTGLPRLLNGIPLWQVDMLIQHGSSGSPVFDENGNLVAVIKGRYRGTSSLGFLIPFEIVADFLSEE